MATSGWSTGSTTRRGGLTWQRIASGLFQPLGLKIVDGPDLRRLPRPDRLPPRPQRRRRDRLLRELQQRPPGHRALPRVRDGPANRRRGQLLLRQGGPPRPDGASCRSTARSCASARTARAPTSWPPASAPQRRLPQPRRHVLPHRPGRVLDPEEPDQLGQTRAASTATCGAITTSPTRPTARWSRPSAGSPTPSIARPPNWSGSRARRQPGGRCEGSLLSLSYGNGKIFVVPHEIVGRPDAGRGVRIADSSVPDRRHARAVQPVDGQLYTCGLFAWAGDRTQPGGFYRVRATGKPLFVPIGLQRARRNSLAITFTGPSRPEERL